jgi:hypothetical protein
MNRFFVVLALVVCLTVAPSRAQSPRDGAIQNPFFVFEDGLGVQSPAAQVALAKQIGFGGISFDGVEQLRERLQALDANGMQLFYLYLGVDVGHGEVQYEPRLEVR